LQKGKSGERVEWCTFLCFSLLASINASASALSLLSNSFFNPLGNSHACIIMSARLAEGAREHVTVCHLSGIKSCAGMPMHRCCCYYLFAGELAPVVHVTRRFIEGHGPGADLKDNLSQVMLGCNTRAGS
jgi:hypothetical protein